MRGSKVKSLWVDPHPSPCCHPLLLYRRYGDFVACFVEKALAPVPLPQEGGGLQWGDGGRGRRDRLQVGGLEAEGGGLQRGEIFQFDLR